MKINKELVNIANDYIRDNINMIEYLQSKNYIKDFEVQGSNKLFHCPFHGRPEKTPSLSIKEKEGFYKCFGQCQSSGNLISFITQYETIVLKKKTNYFITLDNFVKSDKRLQIFLKSNTIFKDSVDINDITKLHRSNSFAFKLVTDSKPSTFLSLSNFIKKKYPSDMLLVKSALHMMERGMSPAEIYDMIVKNEESVNKKVVTYSDVNIGELL